jgi:hypothetical protein
MAHEDKEDAEGGHLGLNRLRDAHLGDTDGLKE